jgi:hypothetical protein
MEVAVMGMVADSSGVVAPAVGQERPRMLVRRLLIRCPVTGQGADTGYELPAMPNLIATHNLLVDCQECGQDHRWQVDDAFLE